jgi:cytochrome c biogenesis protein CcmG/thiol:disulfide interchange protein DsbE
VPRYILLFALLLGLAGCYSGTRPTRIGTQAPDFVVEDGAQKVALHDYRGKIVVLNFWATWCPPCVEEIPSLIQMNNQVRDKNIEIIAVSIDVDEAAYKSFIKQHGVNFLTVRDPQQKSSTLYGTTGWPETFIIDKNGVLRRKFVGPVNWDDPQIVQYLTSL